MLLLRVGNDTDPYNLYKVYNPSDNFGTLSTYTVPNRLNNSTLLPEQTSNVEAGLETKLFKNRIGIDITAYNANTTNQIIPIGTSAATGYNQQFINAGLINNKGIELQLTATPIRRGDFAWDWGVNFARNINKIVELNADDPSLLNVPLANAAFSGSLNAYEGRSFGTIMGTDFLYDKEGNKLTDGAYFHYLAGQPNNSPLNKDRNIRGDADFCISNVLIDNTLCAVNDPRLAVIADKNGDGKYTGRPYGQNNGTAAGEAPSTYSQPSGAGAVFGAVDFKATDILAPNSAATLMNYAEVCFIMAEAKERGFNVAGTTEDWYNKGITASMNEMGIDNATEISAYLAQKDVAYGTAKGDWKQKIGVQKWVALYPQGLQGWAEWRRLDFDKFIVPVNGAIGDIGTKPAPMRLTYPTEEQTKNSVHYEDAVRQIGKDDLKTRLWWDVK